MEKKGFNGKNEEPFIPEGLEYRDEHWQKALDGIIRHEKRADRRRLAWIFSIVGSVLLFGTYAVMTQLGSPTKTVNAIQQSEPGISDHPESSASAPGSDTKNVAPEKNETSNTSQHKTITDTEKLENASTNIHAEVRKSETIAKLNDRSVNADSNKFPTGTLESLAPEDIRAITQNSGGLTSSSQNVPTSPAVLPTGEIEPSTPAQPADTKRMDWDSNFKLQSISLLQLPVSNQVLQAPHTLRSDRNWTEPTWRIWAFAGSSLVTDFSSPLRDIRIDPMAGLRLEYNFNKRIFVDGALEYFAISNVRRPYSQTSIAYDLNYQRTVTTVETHQLHYVSMPLHLGYRLAQRHQISFGLGMSYMITGINEIFQYKQTPTTNTLINRYDDTGFVSGFKDFPFHSELGYAYKLGRNKSIRIVYQFGLTDITRNDYFSSTSFDRNSRLMIDLSIKLKSK